VNPFNFVVCLKAVWRTDVAPRLAGRGGVLSDGAEPVLNPADGTALVTALRLRSALRPRLRPAGTSSPGGEVERQERNATNGTPPSPAGEGSWGGEALRLLALAVGPEAWEPVLRAALAAGADEVLRIWPAAWPEGTDAAGVRTLDGSGTRTRMHAALAAEALRGRVAAGALLVLTGESSADEGHGCFGAFLAQALGLGFAHRVQRLEIAPAGWSALVKLERGYTQDLTLERSAVVTVAGPGEPVPEASWPAWLASRAAPIPLLQPAPPALGELAPQTSTALRPPLPRVKRYRVPPSSLSAEERIQMLVGGQPRGGSPQSGGAQSGNTLLPAGEGVERQAEAIVALLKERGYVKG